MADKEILKKYVCRHPFTHYDVNHFGNYLCCPSWLPVDVSNKHTDKEVSVTEGWFGPEAQAIRESMLDGTYKFCDHKICPDLSSLLNGDHVPDIFVPIEEFEVPDVPMPTEINYGQDRSCNLKCPSCRVNIIPNDPVTSEAHRKKQEIQDEIEESFSSSIKKIFLTGSGDPIYSKIYRDFLINFDASKYPNIESIQIVSNGVLLNEKMWNSFNCTDYIDIIDISFDAGCKETYENVTRLGGDWDRLIENVSFIAGLKDRERAIVLSYVVSEYNYKEMHQMFTLVRDIFESNPGMSNYFVNFRQHVYWETGNYSQEQVDKIAVFDPGHAEHEQFLEELKKIDVYEKVSHNFHHLIR
jgi:sulfatase maturation enzyme AslB (radical SAM superfamily)